MASISFLIFKPSHLYILDFSSFRVIINFLGTINNRQKEYRPSSSQVDRRLKEDSGHPLDSEGAGPGGVASIRGGLCPAVDFERLMDGWMNQ